MKYKWLGEELTIWQVEKIAGIPVKSLERGMIKTGETYIEEHGDGTTSVLPVLVEGMEIEFEREPAAEQVSKLDNLFSLQKLKREGGRDLVAEITALAQRVKLLEDKVK